MRTSRIIALLAWFSITIGSAQEWPVVVKPPTGARLYSKAEDAVHQYRTRHFEIISFQDHREQILKSMASCAESVPAALQAIPLPLYAPPVNGQSKIHIFKNEDSYEEAGGAKGTAGFYDSRHQTVFLQWDFLFDRNTPAGRLPEPKFDLVIHELTHLSMHQLIPRIEVWLSEGIAEYLAAAHVKNGLYRFDQIDSAIAKRIKARHAESVNPLSLPPLSTLVNASFKDWLETSKDKVGEEVLEPYDASLLLVHYCFHGGAERRKQTRQYFAKAHQGKPDSLLIPAADAPDIEKAIVNYWQKKGLKLSFRKP